MSKRERPRSVLPAAPTVPLAPVDARGRSSVATKPPILVVAVGHLDLGLEQDPLPQDPPAQSPSLGQTPIPHPHHLRQPLQLHYEAVWRQTFVALFADPHDRDALKRFGDLLYTVTLGAGYLGEGGRLFVRRRGAGGGGRRSGSTRGDGARDLRSAGPVLGRGCKSGTVRGAEGLGGEVERPRLREPVLGPPLEGERARP